MKPGTRYIVLISKTLIFSAFKAQQSALCSAVPVDYCNAVTLFAMNLTV